MYVTDFFRKGKMDKGYIENGFIVDLANAKKVSEIIYELSQVLDMPESKGKHICLKLGSVSLSQSELTSIKALVELMESELAFISTSSSATLESATVLGIKVSEFTNEIEAPDFENKDNQVSIKETDETDDTDNTDELQDLPKNSEASEKEISPIVLDDGIISEKAEAQEIKDLKNEETTEKITEAEKLPTLYLRKTIRSGQSISSDGNIVIIGDVNPGAEVIAKGDITVWGILGGIAHAGSDGNTYARIRALKLNPVQIRIGGIFARRPDTVNLPYIQKTSAYVPEEAFTYNGSIVIKKIHEES